MFTPFTFNRPSLMFAVKFSRSMLLLDENVRVPSPFLLSVPLPETFDIVAFELSIVV